MKIALVSTYSNATPPLNYGGEVYYWHLANELGKRGHSVDLIAAGGSQCPENGRLHYTPATKDGLLSPSIEAWVARKYRDLLMDADIVHDCSLDHIVAEQLRLAGKKEIVNTINGHTYNLPRPPFNVVTGSKFWQEDAKQHGLKTEMIYWGVDAEFYTPGDGEKEDYLLWIARFHPDKGLELALDLAEFLGFRLKVAGSLQFYDHQIYGKQYLDRIAKLPNVEYVQLPMDSTHHEAKRELMRKAWAFLYPVQYQECFGMVVAEAMACGTPVITTDRGAMPEIVQDEVSGFLCKTKNDFVKAITERMPYFEENRRYHNGFNMWNNARERSLCFDVRKAVTEYEKLYERVIKGESWA